MNNSVFCKTIESVRKHQDTKLVSTEKGRNYLVSEPNCHIKMFFSKNLIAIDVKKAQVFLNKLVYLGLSILGISKIVMYEFWHNYVKPKYNEKAKLCYMDTDNFIVLVKREDIY